MSKHDGVRFYPAQPGAVGWLEYPDVASRLGVSVRTLQRWIAAGCVPSPEYRGAFARFPLDYVEKFEATGLCLPGTYEREASVRSAAKARSLRRKKSHKKPAGRFVRVKGKAGDKSAAPTRKGGVQ